MAAALATVEELLCIEQKAWGLRGQVLGDDGAAHLGNILKENPTIKEINLFGANVGDEGAHHLAAAMKENTTLQRLFLHDDNIGPDGAEYLGEALKGTATLLQISLADNAIECEGARHFAEVLTQRATLRAVDLSRNWIFTDGVQSLAEALKRNTVLLVLDLSGNRAEAIGTRHLAEALKGNATLREINLGGNKIGPDGARFLAEALQVNDALVKVSLASNHIGDEGVRHLAGALKYNTALQAVDLADNGIGDEGARGLEQAVLRYNTTLKVINLEANAVDDGLLDEIQKHLWINADSDLRKAKRQRRAPQQVDELIRPNFAKFKLRLDSSLPDDLHRSFTGYYFPDTRSIALFEVRRVLQAVKFLPLFREATHLKPDGSTYLLEDIEEGATLMLGRLQNDPKPFVITEVDDSHITAVNVLGPDEPVRGPTVLGFTGRGDLEALRRKYASRFSPSVVKALGAAFTVKDAAGQRTTSAAGLLGACRALGVACSEEELAEIIRTLDTNGDGVLSYEEFMFICRGNMSEARRQCVRRAFQKVDYNRHGVVTTEEMKLFYNPMYDQRIHAGQRTHEQLVADFAAQFDANGNGFITFQEFEDYYNGVSAGFKSDQDFVGMMQRFWNLDHRNAAGVSFH